MKMEVLSVQNQFQGRHFSSVIGSTKVKDWTSPLTPPPPPTSTTAVHSNSSSEATQIFEERSSSPIFVEQQPSSINTHNAEAGDIVDGHHLLAIAAPNHYYHQHLNQVSANMESAATAAVEAGGARYAAYNNNLIYYEPQTADVASEAASAASSPLIAECPSGAAGFDAAAATHHLHHHHHLHNNDTEAQALNELSQRLQAELRAAKTRHLACTEVSLPCDLTPRIAAEIIEKSEREPCGVRGCTIFIEFEEEPNNTRRIASFKMDPNTVSTFELYLTLKHDKSSWTSLLPQFLKNLRRSSNILISPHYTLIKNKLYSCE